MNPLDARLVPYACVCWSATLLGILAGSRVAFVSAGVVSVLWVSVTWLRRRSGPVRGVSVALLLGVLALVGIGLQVRGVETHPLTSSAADRDKVTLVGAPVEDPVALGSAGSATRGQVRFRMELEEVRTADGVVRVGGVVNVFASAKGWAHLLPGQRTTFAGKLDTPRNHDLTVAVVRAEGAPLQVDSPSWYQRWAGTVRDRFVMAAERSLPPDQAGLLPGLVVGDTTALDQSVVDAFKAAGLTHLTAVSGANVSIVLGAVLLVSRGVGVGPRVTAVLALSALVAFVVVVRPSPSVLRAAAMGSVTILAMVTGRGRQALPALSGSIVVLLLLFPRLAVDFGFVLSVVATAALIVIAPIWSERLGARGWPQGMAEVVAVSGAAFLVTTPVIAAMAGTVSSVSIVANILAAPVVAVITIVGGVTALVSVVSIPLAEWGARSVTLPLWWLLTVAERSARIPGAVLQVPDGLAGACLALAVMSTVFGGWALWPALVRWCRRDVARSSRAEHRPRRPAPPRPR
ncbi:ComEC/Rec2 family competence protein [Rhodococcus sp. NPDC058521]|uniref:ComEC/Rec2 family competence protein n=1 Tax=Rhodococcus sp. NPDC058521 TaxID=3346536 RepID=UPI003665ABC1